MYGRAIPSRYVVSRTWVRCPTVPIWSKRPAVPKSKTKVRLRLEVDRLIVHKALGVPDSGWNLHKLRHSALPPG
jgi:hypothetical protein